MGTENRSLIKDSHNIGKKMSKDASVFFIYSKQIQPGTLNVGLYKIVVVLLVLVFQSSAQ